MLDELISLWSWPLQAARLGSDLLETWTGAQRVIAVRLPVLAAAAANPLAADYAELGRMVTEKGAAFGRSGRITSGVAAQVQSATAGNARALGRLTGGGLLWPTDWLRLAEANLAATAALTTWPGKALQPIHTQVAANEKRLSAA